MHDSEVAAGIYDVSTDGRNHSRLPHALRIELWQEHLNMRTPEGAAELWDGVANAGHSLPSPIRRARGRTLSTSYRHPERPRR